MYIKQMSGGALILLAPSELTNKKRTKLRELVALESFLTSGPSEIQFFQVTTFLDIQYNSINSRKADKK